MNRIYPYFPSRWSEFVLSACIILFSASFLTANDGGAVPADHVSPVSKTRPFLKENCIYCHKGKEPEGDVHLNVLDELDTQAKLEILNRIEEQVFLEQMPPEDEDQPTPQAREAFLKVISAEFASLNARSAFREKLKMSAFGNYVDHDKLFSGQYADLKGYTPDRRWLISEFIFNEKINELIATRATATVSEERVNISGEVNKLITNPFLLPQDIGVRYYANESLNGGHLLTMITNARNLADYLVSERGRNRFDSTKKLFALETLQNRTKQIREEFLQSHIARLCREYYPDTNDDLLPVFIPVELEAAAEEGENYKKAPYHAAVGGRDVERLYFRDIKRHRKDSDTDEALLAKLEKAWFDLGTDERHIRSRLTFLKAYLPEVIEKLNVGHNKADKYPDYEPLDESEMAVIESTICEVRKKGQHYQEIIDACLSVWDDEFAQERREAGLPDPELMDEFLAESFDVLYSRKPAPAELQTYRDMLSENIPGMGTLAAVNKLWQTLMLRTEYVYRFEFGQGEADEYGRRMMSPHDLGMAISYALTDSSPDEALRQAIDSGRLVSRDDVIREVRRILKKRDQYTVIDSRLRPQLNSITRLPVRELRFFREFFGYPNMLTIFKDTKRFGGDYDKVTKFKLVEEADLLVEHILEQDQNVIETLLGTEKFYVYHSGNNEDMTQSSENVRTLYQFLEEKDWENFKDEDLDKYRETIVDEFNLRLYGRGRLGQFKRDVGNLAERLNKGQKYAPPFETMAIGHGFRGALVSRFWNIKLDEWDYPVNQPTIMANRKGILTHPAWLIAHAHNTATDPVVRGKWIREKLLAGRVPDVPINVEAVVPEDPHKTLRTRLVDVTEKQECWKCHVYMNPLGYPFEMYDDFGRYRTEESLEHPDNLIGKSKGEVKNDMYVDYRDEYKTLPVDTRGQLKGTGDTSLDGEVQDALDMIDRLAQSERVRQSIIRHAFRYFLGRNEELYDSRTLMDADKAYLESQGSFDEVIVSLLSSDSFLYRKEVKD